jgi:hypothetical protein
MLSVVRPDYRVRSLAIEVRNGSLIRAEMERRTLLRDASGRLRPAMVVAHASTQMGYVLAHPLILFGVALAWPGLSLRRRFERLLVSLPLLLLVEALDIPLTLAGGFENAPGGTAQAGAEIDWARIMDGGGRYALCIAAAGMAAAMHASWANSRNPPAVVAAP